MKRFISLLLAGVMAAAIPGAALANDMTQTENLSVLATVACVTPSSANYVLAGGMYDLNTDITVISTNNPTGITIKAWFTDWDRSGGGASVSIGKRETYMTVTQGTAGTLVKGANLPAGSWTGAGAAFDKNLAMSTDAVQGAVLHVQNSVAAVEFGVAGNYTATANYSCVVNN